VHRSRLLATDNHRCLPRRRCAHPEAAPPLDNGAGGGGQAVAHTHRWPGLPAAPSTLGQEKARRLILSLRSGAPAPRRCRSRPPRSRLQLRSTNAPPPSSEEESISTLGVRPPPVFLSPPSTTRVPLTAQHAWSARALTRPGMGTHHIVAISSLNTSPTVPLWYIVLPPHTTNPCRVLRNSTPPLATPCTPSSTDTSPRCLCACRRGPRTRGGRWRARRPSWLARG
jgi:hypothetical protein